MGDAVAVGSCAAVVVVALGGIDVVPVVVKDREGVVVETSGLMRLATPAVSGVCLQINDLIGNYPKSISNTSHSMSLYILAVSVTVCSAVSFLNYIYHRPHCNIILMLVLGLWVI